MAIKTSLSPICQRALDISGMSVSSLFERMLVDLEPKE
jgi:hypothetical protein